ncbi:MAG: hypothetical protein IPJ41_08290 [Phycisphaerales bacterium]|nr:hypothetical protein [Phycisphaerales bacterium]
MSSIPSNLGRVPDLLRSQFSLANITRTNIAMFRTSNQIATGKAISKPSDDAVKAVAIAAVQSRLSRGGQISSNLEFASSSLSTIDQALSEAGDLLLQAQSIASQQLNTGTSTGERKSEAVVVESIIQGLYQIANRESRVGHIFGGSDPANPPLQSFLDGYRYTGQGPGLATDLDIGGRIPITLGGDTLLGSTSSRVVGGVDLDPQVSADTRLAELDGARGAGVNPGVITFAFNGGATQNIDLSGASTIRDVTARITQAIKAYETENGVTVLGLGGVSFQGSTLTIDVDNAGGTNPRLFFDDEGTGTTARDLGLADDDGLSFSATSGAGLDLAPRLTWTTPVADLQGLGGTSLGQIRLRNHGLNRIVDLSQAETLQDVKNKIESSGLGVRVEINQEGTGINVHSEVATTGAGALAIEEVAGNAGTASALGIRSLDTNTLLAEFNDGRGVRIVSGSLNPESGDPDPTLDVDFTITLGNGATIDVNLTPADTATVGDVIDAINFQAAIQLGDQGYSQNLFRASLADDVNGIVLEQDSTAPGMTGNLQINARNNSQAASDLGLLGGSLSTDGSTLQGQDRAKVRPDNIFSWLLDLRAALENDDTSGIGLAGEKISSAVDTLAETRALVGGYADRVNKETAAQEDRKVLDQSLLSQLQDTDFAQAASNLALLQTQLQAGMQTAAIASSLSLLNFLA